MNVRLAARAALCRKVVVPALAVVWLAASGSSGIGNIGPASIADYLAPSLIGDAKAADKPQPNVLDKANVVTANGEVGKAANTTTPAEQEPGATIRTSLTNPSEMLPRETPSEQTASGSSPDSKAGDAKPDADSTEVLDECFVVDACIDRYLWALYQRTPKEDTIKEEEQRKVTIRKKKGKRVTVTRTFTKLIDEDFAWKDRKAAQHAGMSLMDYVIGGMDRSFKLRLFHMLHAADEAGFSPGITSAFRDDYRQSIASGLKAANDRSYHGGSSRGGYGHGLAADVVSVKGDTRGQRCASSETLWKWIDAHGQEFGIGRPYLDRDAPHVAPIDGKEYADHHPGMRIRQARPASKARARVAMRGSHGAAKHARTARSSKTKTI